MIFVGIDVAKDKHDCFILNSEGTVLADVFTIANNRICFGSSQAETFPVEVRVQRVNDIGCQAAV